MKVIKKGRKQKGWSKELKCTGKGNGDGGCGATLLVEQADLFKTHSYVHVEHDVYITFQCKDCKTLTDLPGDITLPQGIRKGIAENQKEWAIRRGAGRDD